MKATVKLTLDGLVRALRAAAHDLADAAEHDYASNRRMAAAEAADDAPIGRPTREPADDRASR